MQSVKFDRAATFYDETCGFPAGTEQDAARLFAMAGNITGDTRIVEPGIGTGRVALPLAQLTGASVVGVDLSNPMMLQLRGKQHHEDITVICGDAMCLPLPDGTFDAAVITHVFHLVADWQQALAEIGRVLRPGGALLYSWTQFDENDFMREWHEVLGRRPTNRFATFSSTKFLDEAGWTRCGDNQQLTYSVSRSPNDYINSLKDRIWSSTWKLTDAEIASGVEKLTVAADRYNLPIDVPLQRDATFSVAPYSPQM
ncbi:MAG: class I SAM-dependent methyltransferase [Chloroflexota bacterium]